MGGLTERLVTSEKPTAKSRHRLAQSGGDNRDNGPNTSQDGSVYETTKTKPRNLAVELLQLQEEKHLLKFFIQNTTMRPSVISLQRSAQAFRFR